MQARIATPRDVVTTAPIEVQEPYQEEQGSSADADCKRRRTEEVPGQCSKTQADSSVVVLNSMDKVSSDVIV